MADKFFTNTYITSSGRQNYLISDYLEDPLFTSFTFDIDYITSPLFYTIKKDVYGYPSVEGLGGKIENALTEMYGKNMMGGDQGYDILPVLSANILDGNKLGFGLQQNVYMDMPLYGATEYIYMVDKRNGGADQNDVMFDTNSFAIKGDSNVLNDYSYKLGDSIKDIVNKSDEAWANKKKENNTTQIEECDKIMSDKSVMDTHTANYDTMKSLMESCNNITIPVLEKNGKSQIYTETQLIDKVNEYQKLNDELDIFKNEISKWVNDVLDVYKEKGQEVYNKNACIKKILTTYSDINDDNKETYARKLETEFGKDFREEYIFSHKNLKAYFNLIINEFNKLETSKYSDGRYHCHNPVMDRYIRASEKNDNTSFLYYDGDDSNQSAAISMVRSKYIIEKFSERLKYFGMLDESRSTLNFRVFVRLGNPPDWACDKFRTVFTYFDGSNDNFLIDTLIMGLMGYKCFPDTCFDEKFTSDKIKENNVELSRYKNALDTLRAELYGYKDGELCSEFDPKPDSLYGKYLAAKEVYENDDYSQAEKAKAMAESENSEMNNMLDAYEKKQTINESNYPISHEIQSSNVSRDVSIVSSQTVLDMLGFISGMKKMTEEYPYIIQGISGLDTAYKNNYGIKDPYLGSGDEKITLTCLESLDLRVSSMFNRYFNAVYDRQYRRERVPINLRRFNCIVYVHDVRNFVARMRNEIEYNRILELTDMYYSVIEFRFYDCEIVPEETGNIFSNVSNEEPSEMTKTNFTFTYGNCVVNFVPPSEVSSYNNKSQG